METMTRADAVLWSVLIALAVGFAAVAVLVCEARYRQWFECIYCHHWFNLLRCVRDTKPKGAKDRPGGVCRKCDCTWSRRVQMNGQPEKGMLFPRPIEIPTDLSHVRHSTFSKRSINNQSK